MENKSPVLEEKRGPKNENHVSAPTSFLKKTYEILEVLNSFPLPPDKILCVSFRTPFIQISSAGMKKERLL